MKLWEDGENKVFADCQSVNWISKFVIEDSIIIFEKFQQINKKWGGKIVRWNWEIYKILEKWTM